MLRQENGLHTIIGNMDNIYTEEIVQEIFNKSKCLYSMGVDPWVDRGTCPLLFGVKGTPCVPPAYFFGVDIFVGLLMHTVFIG